ncbi:hypothetical protein [Aureispira anguillae]|uniref:Uncharacterized protein n=1 Tax=Aureispira anguillae TaxID=2864201 RepID=A0A915YKF6_9BACT|nr:hypothetical protein [Aureispira anguillae]BDS14848.1 hypothetical protein AsAng_0056300 [Aureispira anguillae]
METPQRILLVITILFSTLIYGGQISAHTIAPSTSSNLVEQKPLRFIIYYNGDLTEIMKDNDSYLKTFMAVYDLELINTFEIDELNKGFTLESKEMIEFPNEVARELSLINNVLMVEVVNPDLISET